MKKEFDFSNVEVKEFEPRKRTGNECDHDWILKFNRNGRLEVSSCTKCGYQVWG